MAKNKPIIGLTGAAGSGKTTVAWQFAKLGCAVVDADELNHQVLTHPEVIRQVEQWWGPKVLGTNGQVDREAIGRMVFSDEKELKKLTDLVHPLIAEQEKKQIEAYQGAPEIAAIVLDVPLLFEVGQEKWCDAVVFVAADESLRNQRLRAGRGWEVEKAKKIENLQLALDLKEKMSDYVIHNNSGIPDLAEQVGKVFSAVMQGKKS